MVIPDLSAQSNHSQSPTKTATATDRFLAGVFDMLLLVPIATFVPSMHIREARMDYLQGFESNIWYQIVLLWILTYIVVQSAFLYFMKTTPGGMLMHTRVRSLNGALSWNQCLVRSAFSLFSWVFLGLPFLEVITHPMKRAWHDRVSDTVVVDLKMKPVQQNLAFSVQGVRVVMIVGIFLVLMSVYAVIDRTDEFSYFADNQTTESTDSLVAKALLKKDFSEDTQNEIEERIWGNGKKVEKALAYFFKLHVEKNEDVKKALAEQICKWSPSEKSGSLCMLGQYALKKDTKSLDAIAQNLNDVQGLTSKVFLLKELTKNSRYLGALKLYNQLKDQTTLTASFKDSLKIWDVSLFWAMHDSQLKTKRTPASDEENTAIKNYIQERGNP